jgi:hypothetical protein
VHLAQQLRHIPVGRRHDPIACDFRLGRGQFIATRRQVEPSWFYPGTFLINFDLFGAPAHAISV